jgi:transcriptional regulator with XRE-family HTH domain
MPTDTKLIKALSKRINVLRQERNWSFNEMALACDMDKAQVYKICTVGVDLRTTSLNKIAKGCGISPAPSTLNLQ